MYNIDLYTYWKKNFSRGKNFSIHPLDEPGKKKYYSKDSHCVHYLKRTDPFVFKSILGVDYNTLIRQQKEDIETLNSLKSSKTLNTLQNSNQKEIETGKHKTNFIPTEENQKNETEKNNYNYNNRYNTYGNEEDLENDNQKKFRTFKSQRIMRPYHRVRNFKDTYGYENLSSLKTKPGKYLNLINNIKFNKFNKENNEYKRKYDGYTSYEIPLIPLSSGKSQKNMNFGNKLNYTLDCLQKKEGGRNAMNEEELKDNLFKQTSNEFLKKYHLPDVLKIASSTQLIRRQKIGLSKEMGERYNPYSLYPPSKNRIARNYVGDLFKH